MRVVRGVGLRVVLLPSKWKTHPYIRQMCWDNISLSTVNLLNWDLLDFFILITKWWLNFVNLLTKIWLTFVSLLTSGWLLINLLINTNLILAFTDPGTTCQTCEKDVNEVVNCLTCADELHLKLCSGMYKNYLVWNRNY